MYDDDGYDDDDDDFEDFEGNDDDYYDGDFEDDDDDEDVSSYSWNVGDYNCGTCEHWGGSRCFDSGNNNPHYYNNDRMSANDSCEHWEKSYKITMAEESARKERERMERDRKAREEREHREREESERRERETREAAEKLSKTAEQGDVTSQYKLGLLYIIGHGVPIDRMKSIEWICKAAEQGHEKAKAYLQLRSAQDKIEREKQERREEEERERQKIEEEKGIKKERAKKIKKIITTSVVIAAIVIPLGYLAYNSQENSLAIPNGVTIIKESEFTRRQLVNVAIPNSVTTIGNNAFKRNKLAGVTIPDSVTSIGESAFADNRLTSITIGSKVAIGSDAFGSGFETAYRDNGMGAGTYKRLDKKSRDWNVWHDNFEYRNYGGKITITKYDGTGGELVIPASINENPVTVINKNSFNGKNLTSVTIPNSVTSIGINAFANNPITSVKIGAKVKLDEEPGSNGAGVLGIRTGFNTAYTNNGNRAGTYTRPNTNSTKWTRR